MQTDYIILQVLLEAGLLFAVRGTQSLLLVDLELYLLTTVTSVTF